VPETEALISRFHAAHTQVLGISVDSIFCHAGWAQSLGGISFPLLADFNPKGAVAESYGLYLKDAGITIAFPQVDVHFPGGAPAEVQRHSTGDFPHDTHIDAGMTCATCHQTPGMSAAGVRCETCHALHHQPAATCVSCHREGAKDRHDVSFAHLTCSQCHGEKAQGITSWSRNVCTACHVDKVEHNVGVDCHLCHEMPPLSGGGSDGELESHGGPGSVPAGGTGTTNGHAGDEWPAALGRRM